MRLRENRSDFHKDKDAMYFKYVKRTYSKEP